jgi:hypothetical protein
MSSVDDGTECHVGGRFQDRKIMDIFERGNRDRPDVGRVSLSRVLSARRSQVYLAILSAAVVLIIGSLFARRQSIWIDETTQLNGISMGPSAMLAWLLGDPSHLNGVPGDRNPPVSYFLGQLWGVIFGADAQALRWMGVCAVAGAAALLSRAMSRRAGWIASVASTATFAMVPQVSSLAAEIRPYPLMLLFATVAWAAFIAIVTDRDSTRWRHWLAFAVACLLASYTHFYGILMTGGLLCGLAIDFRVRRRPIVRVLLFAAILMVLIGGSLPFVAQAAHMSETAHAIHVAEVLARAARLVVRLFVSPSVAIYPTAMAILLVVVVISCFFGLRDEAEREVVRPVMAALVPPLGLCLVTALVTPTFDALAPHYNAWMLPGCSIAVAMGVRALARRRSRLAIVAVVCLVSINGYGCYRLVSGASFTHGPHNAVTQMLTRSQGFKTAIVVDDTSEWAFLYFPLRYELGKNPDFFLSDASGATTSLRRIEPSGPATIESLRDYDFFLLMHSVSFQTSDIAKHIKGIALELPTSALLGHFQNDRAWRQVSSFRHVSFVGATGSLFERVPAVVR